MDKLSPEQRHKNMAAIHSKDTKPEMIVRRGLWKRGFRYRLNSPKLPGHPDLVLRKYRSCIFVNGCFWHGHNVALPQIENGQLRMDNSPCCKIDLGNQRLTPASQTNSISSDDTCKIRINNSDCCKIPKTNREFWVAKIRRNKERDKEEQKKLAAMGWHCITVWECQLTPAKREETLESLAFTLNLIWLQDHGAKPIPYPSINEEDIRTPMAAEERVER